MSEKNTNTALVRRVNKLLESRVEHDKVPMLRPVVSIIEYISEKV